ncbi:MAG: CocE/NonD family hydrolase [Verrucomicrobiota bacterium]
MERKTRSSLTLLWAILCLLVRLVGAEAADAAKNAGEYDLAAHYDKTEYMISMRDGAKLFTAVYTPKNKSQKYPILLFRTPYSIRYYGEKFSPTNRMAPSQKFVEDGYIFVFQDIRGTYKSEGEFEVMKPLRLDKSNPKAADESTDAYDTIDWLLGNVKNHNGRVGQWGGSYMGWTTVMGMVDAHPALKASSPQASPSDMFIGDDWHHNGAFRLMYTFWWMSMAAQKRDTPTEQRPERFRYGTPWGYEFFLHCGPTAKLNEKYFNGAIPTWKDFIKHPNYDDFWQRQNALRYMNNIKLPVLNVAGWFDAEDFYGAVSIYHEIEKRNPKNNSTLVSGPWQHGGWSRSSGRTLGDVDFGSDTAEWYRENVVFPFFQFYLKDKGKWNPSEAIVFETGRNQWREFDHWPPKNVTYRNLYFHERGQLNFTQPGEDDVADKYISDPHKPVPYSTGIRKTPGHTWMIEDQRQVSTRPDVLTYQTSVLEEDITIAGPIDVRLFVSTDGTDADYFVKLIDVLPDNTPAPDPNPRGVAMGHYQMLVGVEVMRARYRESFSDPKPLVKNKVTPVNFTIWDKFHTFKKGHRIMVQIHSTWFPAYDRNPQQFIDIYAATEDELTIATQRIHRASKNPSHLVLPVIEGDHGSGKK